MELRRKDRSVLLFFIDGVGVGSEDPELNPLASGEFPTLWLTEGSRPTASVGPPWMTHGLDASLGIPGLPQSATGQTSILTGINGPEAMGRHVSGFPGPTLRAILLEHSILRTLRAEGHEVAFLNAFRPEYFTLPRSERRLSATSLATLASKEPFRDWQDLLEGRAVTHDLTHWSVRARGYDLPDRSPEEAGRIIGTEAMKRSFSLFEYFETDRAGHAQDDAVARRCLSDVDRALDAVLRTVDLERTTVIVASDHGNVEDLSVKTHTMNPAFFAAWGRGWGNEDGGGPVPARLTDLAPFVRSLLTSDA